MPSVMATLLARCCTHSTRTNYIFLILLHISWFRHTDHPVRPELGLFMSLPFLSIYKMWNNQDKLNWSCEIQTKLNYWSCEFECFEQRIVVQEPLTTVAICLKKWNLVDKLISIQLEEIWNFNDGRLHKKKTDPSVERTRSLCYCHFFLFI